MKTQKTPLSNVLETPNGKNVASTADDKIEIQIVSTSRVSMWSSVLGSTLRIYNGDWSFWPFFVKSLLVFTQWCAVLWSINLGSRRDGNKMLAHIRKVPLPHTIWPGQLFSFKDAIWWPGCLDYGEYVLEVIKLKAQKVGGRAPFTVVFCWGGLRLVLDGSGRRETGERSLHENGLGSVSVKTP